MDSVVAVGIIGAVFGGVGTLFGIFMKYIKSRDDAEEKRQEAQAKRDAVFVKSISDNTRAMKNVAEATNRAANEAKERNGHLAEIAQENQTANNAVHLQILNSIENIATQKVGTQVVEHQEVKK